MENFKLSNGIEIPAIGFGTWLLEGEKVTEPLKIALEKGYTHIDTTAIYKNEKEPDPCFVTKYFRAIKNKTRVRAVFVKQL